MTLRTRLAVGAAVAVAVTVIAASLSAFLVTRARLLGDVDQSLQQQVEQVLHDGRAQRMPRGPFRRGDRFGGPQFASQVITASGALDGTSAGPGDIPVTARDKAVAAGTEPDYFWDAMINGVPVRGLTARLGPVLADGTGAAYEVVRPIDEVRSVLSGLGIILLVVAGAGIALGAGLGWFISGRALRPVAVFTDETEDLADDGDLSRRLPEGGDDEIGRLTRVFNATLDQLEASADAQQRLVMDASHELRTPLASLRANIEVLQQSGSLPPDEHDALLRDVVQQTDELGALVTDIVHVGENANMVDEVQDVRLDDLVEASIERTRRLTPGITVLQDLSETVVDGVPERLARLVANLLDNAVKWTPADRPIEVRLHDRTLTVRDHGPGFATDDLPHVFDRFYRSPAARGMPGSGLGLSIVRQVADIHGAAVSAGNADGGGAVMTVVFPPLSEFDDN
ncbi:MAG: HAMP domain-containing sensor histidine kinase [Thermoleophilia bacterium]